ncbi:hypothetical protein GGS26DRAFT_480875 [Hypomontagnella submonticulosa]|nr:hypothetical protein GGS26DRAFT_480875 [Hypomontagnella submonticulosa]
MSSPKSIGNPKPTSRFAREQTAAPDDFESPPAYTSHEVPKWNSPAAPISFPTPENANLDGRRHSGLSGINTHGDSYDSHANPMTEYLPKPQRHAGYEPPEAMSTTGNGNRGDGCCCSSTGGCCFSSYGGCCFSSHGGCCFSDNGGCCFSNDGGCCFSSPYGR